MGQTAKLGGKWGIHMGQQVIRFEQRAAQVRARRARDARIRAAQQQAFDEVLCSPDAERRRALRDAVDAFLDACETSGVIPA